MPDQHLPTSPSTPSEPMRPPAALPPATPVDRAFLTDRREVGQLVLVRHGQQAYPSGGPKVKDDWLDPPLSPLGERQAELVGKALAGERVDAVYCSHLRRAHDTAKAIAAAHGLEPQVHPELREIELFRDLPEGKSLRDVAGPTLMAGVQERFTRERRWDLYPYSETSAEFGNRVITHIEGLIVGHPDDHTVVVVCHGGVINAYLGHLLGLTEDMFFHAAHASVQRVRRGDGRRVLHAINETHHLSAEDPAFVTF